MKFEARYAAADRLLHRLAFSTVGAQKALADIEDYIYTARLAAVETSRPVFIASLPRAGTTLLLELLSSLENFAAHTYRQMPFLLTPMLWNSVSRRFHAPPAVLDRAHGDGMTIAHDSPEAFEEVVWRAFWPEKYLADRIAPWEADDRDADGEFERFMKSHMRKLIAIKEKPHEVRYLSKNNANIARVPTIVRLFPDAVVLIPFRHPLDQASSLRRQHRHFKEIHAQEAFTRRYMADIGHFDFGANFRPIDFGGWLNRADKEPTRHLNFWLQYWCAAIEHLLSHTCANLAFVSYEACCTTPATALRHLGERIGLESTDSLMSKADRFRAPRRYAADAADANRTLLKRALALHAELLRQAIG